MNWLMHNIILSKQKLVKEALEVCVKHAWTNAQVP